MTSDSLTQRIRQHQHLRDLRNKLMHLHQMLLNNERIDYEQVHGRASGGEFLNLVLHDQQFSWLHQVSELVVRIDEMLWSNEPVSLAAIEDVLSYARTLLTPSETGNGFESKYYQALQQEPAVVMAHAEVSRLLDAIPTD